MTLGHRVPTLMVGLTLASCSASPLCPERWEDAPEIRGADHCAPPPAVTRAAEAQLTTGLYGYVTVGQSTGCGECEQVLQHGGSFRLYRVGPDGAPAEDVTVEIDADATYEVELPAGEYRAQDRPLTADGFGSEDLAVRLGEGDVVFLGVVMGCAIGC